MSDSDDIKEEFKERMGEMAEWIRSLRQLLLQLHKRFLGNG